MTSRSTRLASLLCLALGALLGAAGCGDSTSCGPGTHEQGSTCVPDVTCGAGTIASGSSCVADGSVVCVQGTRFDTVTGTCLVDATACANGTTLVGSTCVPDDELLLGAAAHVEAAEPNGPGAATPAGAFDAPALGASTTLYGCITPAPDDAGVLQPDTDTWLVSAPGPMVLEITADGIRGLSAGFTVEAVDPALAGWIRHGIERTGDTARRQVYLPAAGSYALQLLDERAWFDGLPTGTADTCYFTTVSQVALPEVQAAAPPAISGAYDGRVQRHAFTAAIGDLLEVEATTASPAFRPAFVMLRGGQARPVPFTTNWGSAFAAAGGFDEGEQLTLLIDPEFDYRLGDRAFQVVLDRHQAQPLPVDGSLVTMVEQNGPALSTATLSYAWFDVAAPGVKRFDLVASKPVDMLIARRDLYDAAGAFDLLANIDTFGGTGRAAFQGEFVRFLAPGRYYFITYNPAATAAGGTYTLQATVSDVPVTPLAYGFDFGPVTLPLGAAFHSLTLTDPRWVEFAVTGTTSWGAGNTVVLEAYDLAQEGWLAPLGTTTTTRLLPVFGGSQPAVEPFAPIGRVLVGDPRAWLVRVRPSGTPDPAASYSLRVLYRAGLVDLGALPASPDATAVLHALASGAPARVLATSEAGNTLRALVHPLAAANLRLVRVGASEEPLATADAGAAGADEVLAATVPPAPGDWVAWTVENTTAGLPAEVELTISTFVPRRYTITSGALPFQDACAGGVTLATGDDDGVYPGQTLPAGFSGFLLFGEPIPATFRVGANGWLSFDTGAVSWGAYQSRPIPTPGAPDGVIAPYWQDLDQVTLCRKDDAAAGTVTYQWTGRHWQLAGQNVQFQAVLHADGVLDFIYGPLHLMATSDRVNQLGASIGVESLSGTIGQQIRYDAPGVLTGTSYTLTPE